MQNKDADIRNPLLPNGGDLLVSKITKAGKKEFYRRGTQRSKLVAMLQRTY